MLLRLLLQRYKLNKFITDFHTFFDLGNRWIQWDFDFQIDKLQASTDSNFLYQRKDPSYLIFNSHLLHPIFQCSSRVHPISSSDFYGFKRKAQYSHLLKRRFRSCDMCDMCELEETTLINGCLIIILF